MRYSYTNNLLKQFMNANADQLLEDPKFQALIVEKKVALDAGSQFVDKTGHDEVHSTKGRIETKYTNYIKPAGELRINKAGENKRNGFDYIRIIDGINERIFEIPHDIWYTEAKINNGEFLWSSTYNTKDKLQRKNTELILKYEVTE